jgi:hypothetical protein
MVVNHEVDGSQCLPISGRLYGEELHRIPKRAFPAQKAIQPHLFVALRKLHARARPTNAKQVTQLTSLSGSRW